MIHVEKVHRQFRRETKTVQENISQDRRPGIETVSTECMSKSSRPFILPALLESQGKGCMNRIDILKYIYLIEHEFDELYENYMHP